MRGWAHLNKRLFAGYYYAYSIFISFYHFYYDKQQFRIKQWTTMHYVFKMIYFLCSTMLSINAITTNY